MLNVDLEMSDRYMEMLEDDEVDMDDLEGQLDGIDDGYICPYCGSCYDLDHIDERYDEGFNNISCPDCDREFTIDVRYYVKVDVIIPKNVIDVVRGKEVKDE